LLVLLPAWEGEPRGLGMGLGEYATLGCQHTLGKRTLSRPLGFSRPNTHTHTHTHTLKSDREVVLAAVSQDGKALEYAATELQSDRKVVLAAVSTDMNALLFAGDDLLHDASFAVEARQRCFFFKIITLAGLSCIVACGYPADLLGMACSNSAWNTRCFSGPRSCHTTWEWRDGLDLPPSVAHW